MAFAEPIRADSRAPVIVAERTATEWFSRARLVRYAGRSAMASHRHDSASLCFVVGGAFEERTRGRATEHSPGHLLFGPAFEDHAQHFPEGGAVKVVLSLAPAATGFLQAHMALEDAPFVADVCFTNLAMRFATELRRADDYSSLVLDGLLFETLGAFGRISTRDGRGVPRWLVAAREMIEAHVPQAPPLADVAKSVNRHPVHLSRAFKSAFGQSIGEYARELRVQRAAGMLTMTRRSIAEIALDCGFHDQAHLTRAIKAKFATTPAAFRAR